MSLRDLLRNLTSRPAHAHPFVPTDRLWKRGVGAAAAAVLVSSALVAQGGITTSATWNDAEWVHSPAVGTLDCTKPEGVFTARGEGRVLSGSLLGIDLDNAAKVSGVTVTNDSSNATPIPYTAQPANTVVDAYRDPLDATALNLVNADLTGLLRIPVNTPSGLIGQYAQAEITGEAIGASGTLTDSGAIDFDGQAAGYPGIATLQLSTLLDSLGYDLGTLISDIGDISLEIGAVAGRASATDTCGQIWNSSFSDAVQRQYLAAGLDTVIESPTVGVLTNAVDDSVSGMESELNGIVGQTGLLSGVTTELVSLLANALSLVTGLLGAQLDSDGVEVSLASIDLQLDPLNQFLTEPITDSAGILNIDLSSGIVRINTAALLGAIRGDADGTTLNGLPPNTNLFTDSAVLPALSTALTDALSEWIVAVDGLLSQALDLAIITVNVVIPFEKCNSLSILGGCLTGWVDGGRIQATISGTLAQLLANTATITVDTSALNLGLVGSLLTGVINAVTGVVTTLLAPLIGAALQGPLDALVRPLARLPGDALQTLPVPILGMLASLLNTLFNSGIVSLTVNAQNSPHTGNSGPQEWGPPGLPAGRFDVAAIRVGVLDLLQTKLTTVYLGRGSVGPACAASQTAQPASPCYGY